MDAQSIIARRVARELRAGNLVNLGIGIPTLVANFVPSDLKVFFQSENGLIGTGPMPEQGMAHPHLTDAGGRPIGALPLTSSRSVDLVVTDMAVLGFAGGRITLQETAPGVTVAEVMAVTDADLFIPADVPQMKI